MTISLGILIIAMYGFLHVFVLSSVITMKGVPKQQEIPLDAAEEAKLLKEIDSSDLNPRILKRRIPSQTTDEKLIASYEMEQSIENPKVLKKKEQNEGKKDPNIQESKTATLVQPDRKNIPKNRLSEKMRRFFGPKFHSNRALHDIISRCKESKVGRPLFFDTSRYISTAPHACHAKPYLLIAVHTRPGSFQRRRLFRDTFASMRYVGGKIVVVIFFVGLTDRETQLELNRESEQYRDIVQRTFVDHYRNMTYKHVAILDWTMEFCPQASYLMKIDDDAFVNIFNALSYLETFGVNDIFCSVNAASRVDRKSSKWKVTRAEFKASRYPKYCMGYGYILNVSRVKQLYWCSVYTKFFWIDDVYVTGILAKKLSFTHSSVLQSHSMGYARPSYASPAMADFMLLAGFYNEIIPETYRRYWRAAITYTYF